MGDGPSGEYKQSFDDKNRIAVVGMAVKYAGAPNVQQFWETLKEQRRGVRKIDAKRLNTTNKALHHASARSKYADSFVSDVYGVLDDVDSEHDLLLQLASDAIADAKTGAGSPLKGMARCGIVSGCLSFPRDETQKKLMPIYTAHVERELGHLPELAGNQGSRWTADGSQSGERPDLVDPASYVASKLGFKGGTPRYCVDAACASALYVLKLASDHLNSGAADVMLCGASCLPEPFFILSGFSAFQALPTAAEESAPFKKNSAGLTPGEGGAVMVLKRYTDAVRDGDHIYGTLLGVAVNNSGTGLPLKPHMPSELGCLRETYERFAIDPKSVQYI